MSETIFTSFRHKSVGSRAFLDAAFKNDPTSQRVLIPYRLVYEEHKSRLTRLKNFFSVLFSELPSSQSGSAEHLREQIRALHICLKQEHHRPLTQKQRAWSQAHPAEAAVTAYPPPGLAPRSIFLSRVAASLEDRLVKITKSLPSEERAIDPSDWALKYNLLKILVLNSMPDLTQAMKAQLIQELSSLYPRPTSKKALLIGAGLAHLALSTNGIMTKLFEFLPSAFSESIVMRVLLMQRIHVIKQHLINIIGRNRDFQPIQLVPHAENAIHFYQAATLLQKGLTPNARPIIKVVEFSQLQAGFFALHSYLPRSSILDKCFFAARTGGTLYTSALMIQELFSMAVAAYKYTDSTVRSWYGTIASSPSLTSLGLLALFAFAANSVSSFRGSTSSESTSSKKKAT